MKAFSNIKPASIQYLGNNTSYINFDIEEINGVFKYTSLMINGDVTYERVVLTLIREKYSQDDEFALNSKSMQLYFNNCTEDQREKWIQEIKAFTDYREQCIAKAKDICNLQ